MIQPWWHYWYGLEARIDAITHWLRGHDLQWNDGRPDEVRELGLLRWKCDGDIICRKCPDHPGCSALVIWCRGVDV